MRTTRLTAGLIGFEASNCTTCPLPCALDASAHSNGVSAPELYTIGHGVCPYNPGKDVIQRERHGSDVIDYADHAVRDGITLVQRLVKILSA